jgi:hypothetical protein
LVGRFVAWKNNQVAWVVAMGISIDVFRRNGVLVWVQISVQVIVTCYRSGLIRSWEYRDGIESQKGRWLLAGHSIWVPVLKILFVAVGNGKVARVSRRGIVVVLG